MKLKNIIIIALSLLLLSSCKKDDKKIENNTSKESVKETIQETYRDTREEAIEESIKEQEINEQKEIDKFNKIADYDVAKFQNIVEDDKFNIDLKLNLKKSYPLDENTKRAYIGFAISSTKTGDGAVVPLLKKNKIYDKFYIVEAKEKYFPSLVKISIDEKSPLLSEESKKTLLSEKGKNDLVFHIFLYTQEGYNYHTINHIFTVNENYEKYE